MSRITQRHKEHVGANSNIIHIHYGDMLIFFKRFIIKKHEVNKYIYICLNVKMAAISSFLCLKLRHNRKYIKLAKSHKQQFGENQTSIS